jgi:hypothetical protein
MLLRPQKQTFGARTVGMSALGQYRTWWVCQGHPFCKFSDEHGSAGEDNSDFGELAQLCIDVD